MNRRTLAFSAALAVAVLAGSAFFACPAYADDVTLTLVPASLTVVEGDTITLTFKAANTSLTDVVIIPAGDYSIGTLTPAAGDASDFVAPVSFSSGTCLMDFAFFLLPGTSCTFSGTWAATPGDGIDPATEVDGDFGVTAANAQLSYCVFSNGMCIGPNGTALSLFRAYRRVNITVTDPVPSNVPEPSSAILLGVGLTSLLGLALRRK